MARSAGPAGPDGLAVLDKPAGWTSHDVVARARRLAAQRKIGHTGTLDPMATGLLVLCLGDATRLVEYMAGHDKRYEGEVVLGTRTDTDDAEGKVLQTHAIESPDARRLAEVAARFTGPLMQRPPAYSAIKVAGQRAYAAARRGDELELAPRPVTVHRLVLAQMEAGRLRLEAECSAGTYVRSLARDIGEELGCGGHLGALRRTAAGRFSVADAITLQALEALVQGGQMEEVLLQPDEGLLEAPAALVRTDHARDFCQGKALPIAGAMPAPAAPIRIYDDAGEFLGVGRAAESRIHPLKVLSSAQVR